MRLLTNIVAASLLIACLVQPTPGTLSFLTGPESAFAGCHQPEHQSPAPQSSNHVCCETGHSNALLQEAFTLAIGCLPAWQAASGAKMVSSRVTLTSDIAFERRPSLVPLRI